jgi:hypothetical protein
MNDVELQQILTRVSVPTIILYGSDTQISMRLYNILSQNSPIQVITENHFDIKRYDNCYEFNMSQIRKETIHTFQTHYRDLSHYKNNFKSGKRYVILDRYETCKPAIQEFLRVPMERNNSTMHVIITRNLSMVHPAIQSRSLLIRLIREFMCPDNFKLPHEIINDKLLTLYVHDFVPFSKHKLTIIKDIAGEILKYNLSISELLGDLLQKILINVRWTHRIKYEITSYITEQEQLCHHAYRKIITIESILVNLYYRLSFTCD